MSDLKSSEEKCLILFHFPCLYYILPSNWEMLIFKSHWFCFIFFACAHFCREIERSWFHMSLKYFTYFLALKNDVRFQYLINVWFCLNFLVSAHFRQKLADANFKVYWNTLIFSINKFALRSKFASVFLGFFLAYFSLLSL